MLRLFLDNSGARMDQIREGDVQGDAGLAEKGSHSLKSSAANVGAQLVRELANDIENAAMSEDMDTIRSIMPGLEDAYSPAIAELASAVLLKEDAPEGLGDLLGSIFNLADSQAAVD